MAEAVASALKRVSVTQTIGMKAAFTGRLMAFSLKVGQCALTDVRTGSELLIYGELDDTRRHPLLLQGTNLNGRRLLAFS